MIISKYLCPLTLLETFCPETAHSYSPASASMPKLAHDHEDGTLSVQGLCVQRVGCGTSCTPQCSVEESSCSKSRGELAAQSWCRAFHYAKKRGLCSCCTVLRKAVAPVHRVGAEHSTVKGKGACPQCSCRVLHNSVESCCPSAQRTS